jgi:hypothetical protein
MRWVEHVAHMEEVKNAYEILVGKCGWKREWYPTTSLYILRTQKAMT